MLFARRACIFAFLIWNTANPSFAARSDLLCPIKEFRQFLVNVFRPRTLSLPQHEAVILSKEERLKLLHHPVNPQVKSKYADGSHTFVDSERKYASFNAGIKSTIHNELTTAVIFENGGSAAEIRKPNLSQLSAKNNDLLNMLQDSGLTATSSITMDDIVVNYRRKMTELVKAGKITPDLILEPSLMIKFDDGKKGVVTFGELIPDKSKIFGFIASNEEFLEFLAEGRFLVGGLDPVNISVMSRGKGWPLSQSRAYMHDLYHMTSFYQHPKYGQAIVETSRQRVINRMADLNGNGYSHALETLTVFNHNKRDQLLSLLEFKSQETSLKLEDVIDTFNQMSSRELKKKADWYIQNRESLDLPLGGVVKDPRNSVGGVNSGVISGLVDDLIESKSADLSGNLARLEVALHNTSHLAPEDWIQGLMGSVKDRERTKLYKALCGSGIFKSAPATKDRWGYSRSEFRFNLLCGTEPSGISGR